ncbi:HEAT repeat domain-containing protein [Cerasicoccus frondis]|uniref:HEAT repeat domain-containing protein n=1 Tax=Cerasicoccus frondis TaxID=490090 RepID=UPI00285299E2|nr:hypothetical protein [Cerasicoccus frondis]
MNRLIFIFLTIVSNLSAQPAIIEIIAGNNTESTYESRIKLVPKLERLSLGENERITLLRFLTRHSATDRASEGELATLKNDTADILLDRYPNWNELYESLLSSMIAEDQGTIWPSYILQKLPRIIQQTSSDEIRAQALSLLWATAENVVHPDCATALISLYQLHSNPDVLDRDQFSALLLLIADDNRAELSARTTALEYSARLGDPEAKELAIQYLKTSQPATLKTAAIGVFTIMGTPSDESALMPYTRSQDIRVRSAAVNAIKTIRNRNSE